MIATNTSLCKQIAAELTKLTPYTFVGRVTDAGVQTVEVKGQEMPLSFYVREGGYGNEGKVKIRFDRPLGTDGRYLTLWGPAGAGQISDPSMCVSASKSPAQIAKDIVRRIFTESERVRQLAIQSITDHKKHLNVKEIAAHSMAEAAGSEVEGNPEETLTINPFRIVDRKPGDLHLGYGTYTIYANNVDMKLNNLPIGLAVEIASFIRDRLQTRSKE